MRWMLLILLVFTFGCQKEKVKYKNIVEYKDLSKEPFTPCDRGVDFDSRQCDRTIEDHTFWMGTLTLQSQRDNSSRDLEVIYEFKPNSKAVGTFKRGVYAEDKRGRTFGYLETGIVTRVSHNAFDLQVEWDSCHGNRDEYNHRVEDERDLLDLKVTRYYQRNGDKFFEVRRNKPENILETIILFPARLTLAIVHSLISAFDYHSAQSLFDENVQLSPYKFDMDKMPVNWGCTINHRFKIRTYPF